MRERRKRKIRTRRVGEQGPGRESSSLRRKKTEDDDVGNVQWKGAHLEHRTGRSEEMGTRKIAPAGKGKG